MNSYLDNIKSPFEKKVKDERALRLKDKVKVESSPEIDNLINVYSNKCKKLGEHTHTIKITNLTSETIVSNEEIRYKNLLIQIESIPKGDIKK